MITGTTTLAVTVTCSKCGGVIVAKNGMVANLLKNGRSAICDTCRRQGRQWTSAQYQDYLKTEHWQGVRKRALERAGNKCQTCAATERLQVHHNTYERLGGELMTDVVVLCDECHKKIHGVV